MNLLRSPAFTALAALSSLLPQDRGPQDRDAEVAVDLVVATVDGAPILASEVDILFEEADERVPRGLIVRQLVIAKLLEAKARAAEIVVSDQLVDETMEARVRSAGGPEAYGALVADLGLDFESDRLRVRDSLMVDEYVRHALGQVRGSPHLRPELARQVVVTPREIQEHFHEHAARYRVEARTEIGRLVVPKRAFEDDATALARAEELRTLAARDPAALRGAAEADPRVRYAEVTLTPEQRGALRETLRESLERSAVGAPGEVVESAGAFLVVIKKSETTARPLSFEEAQPIVFAVLTESKTRAARIELSRDLISEAEIWPEGLFPQEVPVGQAVATDPGPP